MSLRKVYSVFHLNLAFSSIEKIQRLDVIHNCYWPLLKLAKENQLPFGIEATGYTLEKMASIDPAWIKELRRLTTEGPCEFIGSGYTQMIGPLVPATVNDWNQKIGKDVYKRILGIEPKIALMNEMVYSAGMVGCYLNNGYDSIIMEWNNPRKYHPEWQNEWRYLPQLAVNPDNRGIPVIWADSIAFQKFQRFAHGEYDLDEYIAYLKFHADETTRYFPLYANDVEIFDFRPKRYKTEANIALSGEWKRIAKLFKYLSNDGAYRIVLPSEVLKGLNNKDGGHLLKLESPEQPIPVKKQEKYNLNRWALTGRDDLRINTKCHKIYDTLKKAAPSKPTTEDWKELCYLWSSDFRTHITSERWKAYQLRLNQFSKKCNLETKVLKNPSIKDIKPPYHNQHFKIEANNRNITIESGSIKCILNKLKGVSIDKLWFHELSEMPLIGTLPHGYYDDISLGADFYSGHSIIEIPGEHKITDLLKCEPDVCLKDNTILSIMAEIQDRDVNFKKEYLFDFFKHGLKIKLNVKQSCRRLSRIHLLNMTFFPISFKKEDLFYATHNGGECLEKFRMGTNKIHHSQSISALISSKHGLGATEGLVIVGDRHKQVIFQHDLTQAAVIPSVHFLPLDDSQYFLRLQYSAQEIDETFKKNSELYDLSFQWEISY